MNRIEFDSIWWKLETYEFASYRETTYYYVDIVKGFFSDRYNAASLATPG